MFVWVLLSNSKKIPSFIDVIITGKGLNNFTYIRHSWPLSSDGSLTCNTYCCLLYTSDAADDMQCVDLGGRRIIKKIFFKQKTAYEM